MSPVLAAVAVVVALSCALFLLVLDMFLRYTTVYRMYAFTPLLLCSLDSGMSLVTPRLISPPHQHHRSQHQYQYTTTTNNADRPTPLMPNARVPCIVYSPFLFFPMAIFRLSGLLQVSRSPLWSHGPSSHPITPTHPIHPPISISTTNLLHCRRRHLRRRLRDSATPSFWAGTQTCTPHHTVWACRLVRGLGCVRFGRFRGISQVRKRTTHLVLNAYGRPSAMGVEGSGFGGGRESGCDGLTGWMRGAGAGCGQGSSVRVQDEDEDPQVVHGVHGWAVHAWDTERRP